MASGSSVMRVRLTLRLRSWLRPKASRAASRPQTQGGVFLMMGPSICGCWVMSWISMVFSGRLWLR